MPSAFYEIDIAFISLCLFFAFFAALIFYLRREDRREGYPLVEDGSGRARRPGSNLFVPSPKTFRMPHGAGAIKVPQRHKDTRDLAMKRTSVSPGSPYVPTGDPMLAGVGPGSWTPREDRPDLTTHGDPKIIPMRLANDFFIAPGDRDPRGLKVYGADRRVEAGTVVDAWIDRAESMIRYLEVKLPGGSKTVLVPMAMAAISGWGPRVEVDAITSKQFANVPQTARNDQITLNEEERIVAYYGGGYLYATPQRGESLI